MGRGGGAVRGDGGIKGVTYKMTISEVTKQVHCKWYVDTVYCLSLSSFFSCTRHSVRGTKGGRRWGRRPMMQSLSKRIDDD